jgi:hypothetical protein
MLARLLLLPITVGAVHSCIVVCSKPFDLCLFCTVFAAVLQVGSWYNQFQAQYTAATAGKTWTPGSNTAIYNNNQRATMLWYHDHA